MAKNYSRNIYSSLNELTKNYSEILKSMKDMIVHSNRFSEYSRNYNNYTQTTTFMKPEISEYPIIKNTKYIPLNKKVFSFSNEKEKKKKTKKIIPKLLKGLNAIVNLIPVNPIKERDFAAPTRENALAFKNKLEKSGINVTIRREMGRDIDGACGQLRRRHLNEN